MFRGEFHSGDVIIYLADGGGGFGLPYERDAQKVQNDVIDGYVSMEAAANEYGVILTDDLEIDRDATAKQRGGSS